MPAKFAHSTTQAEWLRKPDPIVVREGGDWPELMRCIFNDPETQKEETA